MRYWERQVALSADPLRVAATLAATSTDDNVLYENHGTISWGEGAYATVTVRAGEPLSVVASRLAEVDVEDWRAYGWAAFELSYALHDLGDLPDVDVVTLMIPRREVRFENGSVLLRALTVSDVEALESRLAEAVLTGGIEPADARVVVDVDDHDAETYRAAVALGVAEIRSGALDKVILSRVVPVPEDIDMPATYLTGRVQNSPARSFLLRLGGWEALGFSPEIVIGVSPDGQVVTQPLAGTRAFFGDEEADQARRDELYRDAKEVFEHAISVRLAAVELSSVCTPSSVRVEEFMSVKERGSVQHLASQLSGTLAEGRTSWDAFAALFPAVTASGIPKAPACELIRRAETRTRGLYSGAVLTVEPDGAMDAALILRSVFRRDGETWLRAGAGIVAQSTPERELEETREKLCSVSRFLVPALQPAVPAVS
ncbi:salicylate synthetase [Lentzea albidocapillata subsp. violacea]|uniref:Salicylate synthetase n=1 Tax=Lentzea albidocapillata subsp. violacea TaxID=128104 RepID=A0A1G9SJ96_9PSEU|nr:salicylate synthase [Lentzea albidocapillata]SDM35370.1 salicylate synthetase [Lentzea albidocapillata subsp. violacea]